MMDSVTNCTAVEGGIGGYPPYPCEELAVATKPRQGIPYLNINVLHKVVGIFVGKGKAANMPIQTLAVGIYNSVKGATQVAILDECLYFPFCQLFTCDGSFCSTNNVRSVKAVCSH